MHDKISRLFFQSQFNAQSNEDKKTCWILTKWKKTWSPKTVLEWWMCCQDHHITQAISITANSPPNMNVAHRMMGVLIATGWYQIEGSCCSYMETIRERPTCIKGMYTQCFECYIKIENVSFLEYLGSKWKYPFRCVCILCTLYKLEFFHI